MPPELEISNKSPMLKYIREFDVQHIDWGYNKYWVNANQQDRQTWNALFLSEIKFREEFGLNIIWSDEGGQGDGKSTALIRKKQVIDNVYKVKFNKQKFLSQIHFFTDDLEASLSKPGKRDCNVLDEQIREYGLMARFQEDRLANYEDTYRKPQRSIGYASPSLRKHEHFFIFEAMGDFFVNPKNYEVSSIEVMLKTKRKSDSLIVPRGILKFKTPEVDLWEAYNKKKDKFIEKMRNRQGGMMERIEKDAQKVIDSCGKDNFLRPLKDGGYMLVGKDAIKLHVYKTLGMRAFTVAGYDLLTEEIRRILNPN